MRLANPVACYSRPSFSFTETLWTLCALRCATIAGLTSDRCAQCSAWANPVRRFRHHRRRRRQPSHRKHGRCRCYCCSPQSCCCSAERRYDADGVDDVRAARHCRTPLQLRRFECSCPAGRRRRDTCLCGEWSSAVWSCRRHRPPMTGPCDSGR